MRDAIDDAIHHPNTAIYPNPHQNHYPTSISALKYEDPSTAWIMSVV